MWKDTLLCIFSRRKGAKNIKEKRNQKSQERPIICEERCLFCCEGMKSRVKDSFSHAWLVANSLLCDSSSIFAQNPEKKGIIVSKVRVNYYSGIGIQRIIVPPLYTHNKNRNFSLVKPKIGVGLYHHAYTKQCTTTACSNQSNSHLLKNCKTNTAIIITCFDSLFFVCLPIDFFFSHRVSKLCLCELCSLLLLNLT